VSGLFIELYLDENVNVVVADLVRSHGFVATTAREAGQLGRGDAEQLAYAVSRRGALLIHNRDDFAAGQTHHGIILAVRRPPREIARRLLALLNQVTADGPRGRAQYI
jgi:predicted nuclease of predicted toxin-antitoxin system